MNFQPVLIPPPSAECEESDVEDYFQSYYTSNSDYDADSEPNGEPNISHNFVILHKMYTLHCRSCIFIPKRCTGDTIARP